MKTNFPYKIIDLTHTIDESTPTWTHDCGFHSKLLADYSDFDREPKFRVNELQIKAGIGTHIDAPSHCVPGAPSVDQLKLDSLISQTVCIDVSTRADENYLLSLDDVKQFEEQHGAIPRNVFILVYTGWSQFWNQKEKFHNNLKFPTVSEEACNYFVEKHCVGLGIDTLSPDRADSHFPVHSILLGSGRYIVENAANLEQLPAKEFYTLALPIKARDCTESPIRLIALVPK